MGIFVDLVEQFNANLNPEDGKKNNFVGKKIEEEKKRSIGFRGQNLQNHKLENNQKLDDIFAKKLKISGNNIARVAPLTHLDFTFSRQWRAFLRHLSKLQKMADVDSKDLETRAAYIQKNQENQIIKDNKIDESEIEAEEEEIITSDLEIKLNQTKVDPDLITKKSYIPIINKITKNLPKKSSIFGFSIILSFLYLIKNLILQLIKGIVKYRI